MDESKPRRDPQLSGFEAGQSVGRYRILKRLGSGAMGDVFLAEDPRIERRLAIKTLRLQGVRPADFEERTARLMREAKAAGRLSHPHIVTLFDVGEDHGLLFLAFEYVPGRDLHQRLVDGPPLSLREALRIARETAEGLEFAHRHGIVHRDIKPGNLLLDADGRVKISDFGIAKVLGQNTELTTTGMVIGSPHYLSPEQVRGEPLDGTSDVFSLGVVLYEMISGRRPFDGETLSTLVYQILHLEPEILSTVDPRLPAELSQLVQRMLDKDRHRRMTTAGEAAEELMRLEALLPPGTLDRPTGSTPEVGTAPTRHLGVPPPPPPPPATGAPSATSVPSYAPPATGETPRGPKLGVILAVAGVALVLIALVATGLLYVGSRWVERRLAPTSAEGDATAGLPAGVESGDESLPSAVDSADAPNPQDLGSTAFREAVDETVAEVPPPHDRAPETSPPPVAEPERRPSPVPPPPPPAKTTSSASASPPKTTVVDPGPRLPEVKPPVARPSAISPSLPAAESSSGASEPAVVEPSGQLDPTGRPPRLPPVDQTLTTGLDLVFRVQPDDAFFLLDGRLIGRVSEYTGAEGSQGFRLPDPGRYVVVLRKGGYEDYRMRIVAEPDTRGATALVARLKAIPASEVPLGDLPVYRVSEAVAFRVRPVAAVLLVDGEPRGPAVKFSGRIGRASEWLRLERGIHRISFVAPGHKRVDIAVDFTAGASEERQRVTLELPPDS
ncbi:MAG: protein kinase [Acidobacteria bacterium]|nr:protein kinase [Acidobacteriota bacterium]